MRKFANPLSIDYAAAPIPEYLNKEKSMNSVHLVVLELCKNVGILWNSKLNKRKTTQLYFRMPCMVHRTTSVRSCKVTILMAHLTLTCLSSMFSHWEVQDALKENVLIRVLKWLLLKSEKLSCIHFYMARISIVLILSLYLGLEVQLIFVVERLMFVFLSH